MKIYTKQGDGGYTSLSDNSKVSKTDDRIEFLGCVDELSSHLGLAKVVSDENLKAELTTVQKALMKVMASVADNGNGEYKISDETSFLEGRIDYIESKFCREKAFVLFGGCELSARLDVARAVSRKAERQLCRVAETYETDCELQQYMNRLSDYLYVLARFADCEQ